MNKSIGDILKDARLERGLAIPDISTKLCISKTYLRALEGNDKENLPAQTFTIGFLRTYATHLGLDADEMVYKAKGSTPEEVPSVEVNVPEKAHDSTMPSIMVLTVISAALISVVTGYSYFAGDTDAEITHYTPQPQELVASISLLSDAKAEADALLQPETVEVVEPEVVEPEISLVATNKIEKPTKPVETVAENRQAVAMTIANPVANPVANLVATNPEVESFVEIRAVSDTWMMIVGAQNTNLYDDIIHKGESYNVPVGKGLFLTTGNAGGLEFFHSGQQLPVPSGHGTILNALALDQVVLDPSMVDSQQQELLP